MNKGNIKRVLEVLNDAMDLADNSGMEVVAFHYEDAIHIVELLEEVLDNA